MKVAALALLLCPTRLAAADSHATLVIDKCMLSVQIDNRVIYRGKPKCKNEPRELDIKVPRSRGVHVRTNAHLFYASAGFWAEHDDAFLIPLTANKRYEIGEGYAVIAGDTPPKVKHCVEVSRDRGSKLDGWAVTHYGTREGPHDMTTRSVVGGEHPRHELHVSSDAKPADDKVVTYYRLQAGTYRFHVTRAGKVSLSFTDADMCAAP
jgi:hypothetical protein